MSKYLRLQIARFKTIACRSLTTALALMTVFACTGCNPETPISNPTDNANIPVVDSSNVPAIDSNNSHANQNSQPVDPSNLPESSFRFDSTGQEQIAIATFNIQSLGRTKIAKPEVTSVLVDIIRRFDVTAIQELRDVNQSTIPKLLRQINAGGLNFKAIVGPRQGYVVKTGNSYFEQGVFIYDANTIAPVGEPYVAEDLNRVMHRAPFVSQFRCLTTGPYQPFTFTLLNVHVDPDEIATELPAMIGITRRTFENHNEDDFIVLGDLNATPNKIESLPWLENQTSLISNSLKTNTAGTRTIDNIVLDRVRTSEFNRQAGVIDMEQLYNLTRTEAAAVSDHRPVWATFSAYEHSPSDEFNPPDKLPIPGDNGSLERLTSLPYRTDNNADDRSR